MSVGFLFLFVCMFVFDLFAYFTVDAKLGQNYRLVGGSSNFQGRLEFKLTDGQWGSVCSDNLDVEIGNKVCQSLGYDSVLSLYKQVTPQFGSGQRPIYNFQESNRKALFLDAHCSSINNIISIRCFTGKERIASSSVKFEKKRLSRDIEKNIRTRDFRVIQVTQSQQNVSNVLESLIKM